MATPTDKLTIAVLGAAGFLGSHMVSYLKDKGHTVRSVSKSIPKQRSEYLKDSDELMYLNMQDFPSALLATKGVDYVVHLAADMGGVGYFSQNEYAPFLTNMTIDMNVVKACELNGVKRLFYASSACIYPIGKQMIENQPIKLTEQDIFPAQSDRLYGWEKLMGLMLCEKAPFDARVGILNTIYGEGQEYLGDKAKFPPAIAYKAIEAQKTGEPIKIWGDGQQLRQFLHVDDAMDKIYTVLLHDEYFGPVNITSSKVVSIEHVAKMCADILGIEPLLARDMSKPSGVLSREISSEKYDFHYGHSDKVSLREGFERLVGWIASYENQ